MRVRSRCSLYAKYFLADTVVAQGWEAGGHVIGQVSGLTLIPEVVDAVAPIPFMAAGGILVHSWLNLRPRGG